MSPPPLSSSHNWSPVKYHGGYYKESKVSFRGYIFKIQTSSSSQQKLHLSSLNIAGSLFQLSGSLACNCCY